MVCACPPFFNCTACVYPQLPICIHKPHSTTKDTYNSKKIVLMATRDCNCLVFTFTGASYCVWQFLERVCESRDPSYNFRLHILGISALDCAHSGKLKTLKKTFFLQGIIMHIFVVLFMETYFLREYLIQLACYQIGKYLYGFKLKFSYLADL